MLYFDLNEHHDILVECVDSLNNNVYTETITKIQMEIDKLSKIRKYVGGIAPSEETIRIIDGVTAEVDEDQPSTRQEYDHQNKPLPSLEEQMQEVNNMISRMEEYKIKIQAEIDASTQENPE